MKLKRILTRHINYILCCKSFKIMEFKITFIGSTGLNEDISIKATSFADAENWFIKYKSLENIVNIKKTK